MPKYASFDPSTSAPHPVTGFYDTDAFDYPSLPPDNSLVEMTDEQWETRRNGRLAVRAGVLVAHTPPVHPRVEAARQLATRIAAGIAIASSGTPAVSGTYALDEVTMAQIGSVARDFASNLGLPGGAPTFTYPDASGTPKELTGNALTAIYKAQRDLLFVLNTQAAIVANGGEAKWPAQTAVIA